MKRKISYPNDDIFKKFIDLQDEDSIERIDREFEGIKRHHVDFNEILN